MGGRSCEELPGATLLATKCLAEAASGLGSATSRTELGLFCMEKQMQVRIDCSEESSWVEIAVPKKHLESAFELFHCILARPLRPDALSLKRATAALLQQSDAQNRTLEGVASTALSKRLYDNDHRYTDAGARMQIGCSLPHEYT